MHFQWNFNSENDSYILVSTKQSCSSQEHKQSHHNMIYRDISDIHCMASRSQDEDGTPVIRDDFNTNVNFSRIFLMKMQR